MTELLQKQQMLTVLMARLILFAKTRGYDTVFGQAKRTQAEANANAKSGSGISNSLHLLSLAVDLLLFKDEKYLTNSDDYKFLGDFWKLLDPDCRWGGDFKDAKGHPKPDGNHFSVEFQGVK